MERKKSIIHSSQLHKLQRISSHLHEFQEPKLFFDSRIEFIRSKLSNFSAHVSGATVSKRAQTMVYGEISCPVSVVELAAVQRQGSPCTWQGHVPRLSCTNTGSLSYRISHRLLQRCGHGIAAMKSLNRSRGPMARGQSLMAIAVKAVRVSQKQTNLVHTLGSTDEATYVFFWTILEGMRKPLRNDLCNMFGYVNVRCQRAARTGTWWQISVATV